MDIKKAIKKNPLSAITVAIAVVGVVFSVFNFYLLSNISPLERRVEAIEKRNEINDPLVGQFIEVKTDVRTIKEDIKDIKSFLGVR